MELFAALLDQLVITPSRNRKMALLVDYFHAAPDPDRGWALAVLTDQVPVRLPLRRVLLDLMAERVDPVLYKLSRDYVGDTAETVALLWPDGATAGPAPGLGEVVSAFQGVPRAQLDALLAQMLDRLDARGRWALLKLLGGAPRAGVSARLAKVSLAQFGQQDVGAIEEIWHSLEAPFVDLFAWLEGQGPKPDPGQRPMFRPVMLAHAIEHDDWAGLKPQDWVAEWKWDGIRVQVAANAHGVSVFSRAGDDISAAFPDVCAAFASTHGVVDGELLVVRDGVVAPFNDLQQRLNRKTVTPAMQRSYPAHVRLYDLLFDGDADLRTQPFSARRPRLEAWHAIHAPPITDVSPLIVFESFDELHQLWSAPRAETIEGLMLKRYDSAYLPGRVRGQWFKWKRAALTLDCVLMYAQRGSGKRSSFYSDYTFGVWRRSSGDRSGTEGGSNDGGNDNDSGKDGNARDLVPVGKAYSGFTDAELKELDRWIRSHTVDQFGPVRAVAPGLVLEVAFDAVHRSVRHKSGVAMRFPRIHRIRWDKPAAQADTLETVLALVAGAGRA